MKTGPRWRVLKPKKKRKKLQLSQHRNTSSQRVENSLNATHWVDERRVRERRSGWYSGQ